MNPQEFRKYLEDIILDLKNRAIEVEKDPNRSAELTRLLGDAERVQKWLDQTPVETSQPEYLPDELRDRLVNWGYTLPLSAEGLQAQLDNWMARAVNAREARKYDESLDWVQKILSQSPDYEDARKLEIELREQLEAAEASRLKQQLKDAQLLGVLKPLIQKVEVFLGNALTQYPELEKALADARKQRDDIRQTYNDSLTSAAGAGYEGARKALSEIQTKIRLGETIWSGRGEDMPIETAAFEARTALFTATFAYFDKLLNGEDGALQFLSSEDSRTPRKALPKLEEAARLEGLKEAIPSAEDVARLSDEQKRQLEVSQKRAEEQINQIGPLLADCRQQVEQWDLAEMALNEAGSTGIEAPAALEKLYTAWRAYAYHQDVIQRKGAFVARAAAAAAKTLLETVEQARAAFTPEQEQQQAESQKRKTEDLPLFAQVRSSITQAPVLTLIDNIRHIAQEIGEESQLKALENAESQKETFLKEISAREKRRQHIRSLYTRLEGLLTANQESRAKEAYEAIDADLKADLEIVEISQKITRNFGIAEFKRQANQFAREGLWSECLKTLHDCEQKPLDLDEEMRQLQMAATANILRRSILEQRREERYDSLRQTIAEFRQLGIKIPEIFAAMSQDLRLEELEQELQSRAAFDQQPIPEENCTISQAPARSQSMLDELRTTLPATITRTKPLNENQVSEIANLSRLLVKARQYPSLYVGTFKQRERDFKKLVEPILKSELARMEAQRSSDFQTAYTIVRILQDHRIVRTNEYDRLRRWALDSFYTSREQELTRAAKDARQDTPWQAIIKLWLEAVHEYEGEVKIRAELQRVRKACLMENTSREITRNQPQKALDIINGKLIICQEDPQLASFFFTEEEQDLAACEQTAEAMIVANTANQQQAYETAVETLVACLTSLEENQGIPTDLKEALTKAVKAQKEETTRAAITKLMADGVNLAAQAQLPQAVQCFARVLGLKHDHADARKAIKDNAPAVASEIESKTSAALNNKVSNLAIDQQLELVKQQLTDLTNLKLAYNILPNTIQGFTSYRKPSQNDLTESIHKTQLLSTNLANAKRLIDDAAEKHLSWKAALQTGNFTYYDNDQPPGILQQLAAKGLPAAQLDYAEIAGRVTYHREQRKKLADAREGLIATFTRDKFNKDIKIFDEDGNEEFAGEGALEYCDTIDRLLGEQRDKTKTDIYNLIPSEFYIHDIRLSHDVYYFRANVTQDMVYKEIQDHINEYRKTTGKNYDEFNAAAKSLIIEKDKDYVIITIRMLLLARLANLSIWNDHKDGCRNSYVSVASLPKLDSEPRKKDEPVLKDYIGNCGDAKKVLEGAVAEPSQGIEAPISYRASEVKAAMQQWYKTIGERQAEAENKLANIRLEEKKLMDKVTTDADSLHLGNPVPEIRNHQSEVNAFYAESNHPDIYQFMQHMVNINDKL